VLLRDGGGLVDVRYSASCGGHGEDNDAIWGGEPDPSLRGRVDSAASGASAMSRITDDNLGAQRFYERAGMRVVQRHARFVDAVAAVKPHALLTFCDAIEYGD